MDAQRFHKLAEELAARDPELAGRLRDVRQAAGALREHAVTAVEAFRERASELGASYLGHIAVTAVEPDEKHVDAVQFKVARGRLELICVAIARGEGKIRVVGPFKRGSQEGPCAESGLRGPEVEELLEERIAALVREAAGA